MAMDNFPRGGKNTPQVSALKWIKIHAKGWEMLDQIFIALFPPNPLLKYTGS